MLFYLLQWFYYASLSILLRIIQHLNKIYKIEETGIVMQNSGGHHPHLMTLKIPDRALIQQIKRHRDNLENKLNTIKIQGYFDNWSYTEYDDDDIDSSF